MINLMFLLAFIMVPTVVELPCIHHSFHIAILYMLPVSSFQTTLSAEYFGTWQELLQALLWSCCVHDVSVLV